MLRMLPGGRFVSYGRYYKALFTVGGESFSLFATGYSRVRYIPWVWTKANPLLADRGYHLTVFKGLTVAEEYLERTGIKLNKHSNVSLWRCEIWGRLEELPRMGVLNVLSGPGILFSSNYNGKWPHGTVMAREVMITDKLM